MVKKAKDRTFLFFPFFVYEVAVYLFIYFVLFDVCVKQCCPTISWNFILLSSNNNKKRAGMCYPGFRRKRERKKEIKNVLEEIMDENLSNLKRETDIQIQ